MRRTLNLLPLCFLVAGVSAAVFACQERPAPPPPSHPTLDKPKPPRPAPSAANPPASASAPTVASAPAPATPPSSAPTVEWARRWGSFGDEYSSAFALSPDGTWVMAGSFQFDMDLDGRKLIGESELQMGGGNFIANFDTTAHLNWVTHFHGKANEHVDAMSIGPNNTIVFTGYFRDLDAGCGRLRSKHFDDILLGTLSADGRCVWTRGYGSTDNDSGNALAVDRLGNMTVFGSFKSGTNFGGGPLTTIGYAGLFAASFTSDGKHRWSRSLWGHPLVNPKAAAVDEAGQVYVTLWFQDTIDIGDGPRKSQGKSDILLAALSPDGRLQWSLSVGGAESDYANGLYVDPHTGDILLAGSFQQSVDIGGDHLTSAGGADAFVARFDKGGKVKWARSLGSPEHDGLQHLALDAAGNIYALGYHTAPLTYGESHLQHLGRSDLLLVSMGPDGSPRWAMSLGGPQYDASTGVLVEPSGRILVAGSFHTQATFGPVHLTSAGGMDMFVAALRP